MLEISDDDETFVERASSLRNGLRGSRPIAIGCANYVKIGDRFNKFVYISYDRPHMTEYAGVHLPGDGPYPGDRTVEGVARAGCLRVSINYLKTTLKALDASAGYRWIYEGMTREYWDIGNRGTRCYIGSNSTRKRVGSLKGKPPSQW